jgi:hypothetical protein
MDLDALFNSLCGRMLRPNRYFTGVLPDPESEKIGGPQGRNKNVARVDDIWVTGYSVVAIPSAGGVPCRYDVALPPTIGVVMLRLSAVVPTAGARPISHRSARKG